MKFYYYVFYKLFKFWEYVSIPKFWSDFKANISIAALEIWLILTIINYYQIFINKYFHLEKNTFIFILGVIILFHYVVFIHFDKWKENNTKFEQLPKKENMIGGIIVWSIIVFIIVNLIFSFYLMSRVDWSQYRNK